MTAAHPTVRFAAGEISGTSDEHVRVFRNIPYAAPPVGPLRWQPPQPVAPWTGVRDGTHFGDDPVQLSTRCRFAARSRPA